MKFKKDKAATEKRELKEFDKALVTDNKEKKMVQGGFTIPNQGWPTSMRKN